MNAVANNNLPWTREEFEEKLRTKGQGYHIYHPFYPVTDAIQHLEGVTDRIHAEDLKRGDVSLAQADVRELPVQGGNGGGHCLGRYVGLESDVLPMLEFLGG